MTSKKSQLKLPLWVMGVVLAVGLPGRGTAWDGASAGTVEVIHTTLAQLSDPGGFFAAIAEPNSTEVGGTGSDTEPILDLVITGATWSKRGGIFMWDTPADDPHCPTAGAPPCFSDVIKFVNDSSGTANLWFASDEADQISAVPNVVHPDFVMNLDESAIGPGGLNFNGTFTNGQAFRANLFSDVVSVAGTNSDSVTLISSRVPEPASLTLLGSGLLVLAGLLRRRVRK